MIKIHNLNMPVGYTMEELRAAIVRFLKIPERDLLSFERLKESLDARKKNEIHYQYAIAASVRNEAAVLRKLPKDKVSVYEPVVYRLPEPLPHPPKVRPVIVGLGPAGLLCGYLLASAGLCPVILERGKTVTERVADVNTFWEGEALVPDSNVQFGEGGAGTFSDGKLNTLVKDREGRGAFLMQLLVKMGAPEEILYRNKPHIGTDLLQQVVVNLRSEIERMGGTVRFSSKLTGLRVANGRLTGVEINHGEVLPANICVLALGHSARDTFEMLLAEGVAMQPKPFAIGVRMEHPREWINEIQYGKAAQKLPTADYKLTHTCRNGLGVYSFCMCPGGYVVNASSEPGRLCVNGMSNHDRMADNSNAALVVTIAPEQWLSDGAKLGLTEDDPLSGMKYQRYLEEQAYLAGGGSIPVQTYADFTANRQTTSLGEVRPCMKGKWQLANVRQFLPGFVTEGLLEGIEAFDRKMPGYARADALLSATEARTSSPVRMERNDRYESGISGIYPCGEGAGYAGGITSAAMDGMKVAEAICQRLLAEAEHE